MTSVRRAPRRGLRSVGYQWCIKVKFRPSTKETRLKRGSQKAVEDARQAEMEEPVRANAGMRYDLWFAEDALYRVEVLGRRSVALALALAVLPALSLLVLAGPMGLGLTAGLVTASAELLLVSIALAYLILTVVVWRRRRVNDMTFRQVKSGGGTKKISWDQVRWVALTRRTTVRLEVQRGRFTQVVRAGVRRNDANRLKSIIVGSKAGRSFDFRDGVLR